MEPWDAFLNADKDALLPTSIEANIKALTLLDCPNLTSSIVLDATGNYPSASGGFSDVYRGVLHDGTRVAIKSLRACDRSSLADESDRRKVLKHAARELYHWSKLKHSNVLTLMGAAVFKGSISMISQWMENGNMVSYLKLKPDADRVKLCKDVCAGLAYIHMQGMAHGNLKAANVLISPDGTALIAGFTQLRDLTRNPGNDDSNSAISIRWAAPEVLDAVTPQASKEADVYAYGMTVLEALTGNVPYHTAQTDAQLLILIMVRQTLPPRPDSGISEGLWELLNLCWSRDPSKRPSTTRVGNCLEALFPPPDGSLNPNEDIIGGTIGINEIITALARRGCRDLTSSIDFAATSDYPSAGGRVSDVYRGVLYDGTRIAIRALRLYESSSLEGDSWGLKVLKRTARELYHWSKLKHPNVLPLMGLAVFKGYLSMVTLWVENGHLASYLRHKPGADRITLCMDVCAGLTFIHASGMAHGDLKATNIMVSADGRAMIAGFGNAEFNDLTLRFTNTTKTSFSIRWMAPELLEDEAPQASLEADVYAYGMTVLEIFTGKMPFEGVSDRRVLVAVLVQYQVPQRPGGMSDGLWELLRLCWARAPSERPQMANVGDRLRALFLSHPTEHIIAWPRS